MVDQGSDPKVIQNAPKENIIIEKRESCVASFDDPEKLPSFQQKETQSHVVNKEDDKNVIDESNLKATKHRQDAEEET